MPLSSLVPSPSPRPSSRLSASGALSSSASAASPSLLSPLSPTLLFPPLSPPPRLQRPLHSLPIRHTSNLPDRLSHTNRHEQAYRNAQHLRRVELLFVREGQEGEDERGDEAREEAQGAREEGGGRDVEGAGEEGEEEEDEEDDGEGGAEEPAE